MKIFCRDRICDSNEAMVSVYDHGFLYGMGLFETFRSYAGIPFLLQEHLDRLNDGCRMLGMAAHWAKDEIERIARDLLEANGLADGYFRLSVTSGTDQLGLPAGEYKNPGVILYVKELPARMPEAAAQGKTLQLLDLKRNTPEGAWRLKSFHYMNNILAKRELQRYPWAAGAEGLFLDGNGHLAEGIVSNLFFIKEGTLYTPALETGILPGITRSFVIGLAGAMNLPVKQGLFDWRDLLQADEVFLTNSIQEIVPVARLTDPQGNAKIVGNGGAGRWTARLMQEYRRHTGGVQ